MSVRPDRCAEVAERLSVVHAAGAGSGEQSCHCHFAVSAAAAEAGLAPLHGAPERSLGSVVGWFDALVAKEGEELAVRQSEELLLQWNGFCNQLLPCNRSISDVGSGAQPVPQAEQARVQCQGIPAESLRICCFRY